MITACPICKSSKIALFWNEVWGDPTMHVMRCAGCEMFFLDKGRAAEDQKRFDKDYDKYISAREGTVTEHSGDNFVDLVDESIAERFADIKSHFEGSRATLEVGAERGGFLDRLKGRVPKLTGVDACPDYHDILRKKGFSAYSYIDDVPAGERYDRICMFSLLEHIQNPFEFMKAVAERLEPDGKVVIELPNAAEPLVTLYDVPKFKSFYFQAMHPFVYSMKALDILLEKSGLKKVSVKYKQRYGLANHLQWLKEGVPGGSPVFAELFKGQPDEAYRRALEAAGRTDALYVVAAKA